MDKTYNCATCGKESKFRHSKLNIFCSITCQQLKKRQLLIDNWLAGGEKAVWKFSIPKWAKDYLIEIRTRKCEICNAVEHTEKPIPLEVDHISGDHTDNRLENLRLICPNCHSLTETYKNKNLGHGRKNRK